jgi:quinol---cytochrome-c reductase cytochrome c subunit
MRRAFVRWLTRRSRVPRIPRALLALVLGTIAIVGLSARNSRGQTDVSTTLGGPAPELNAPTKSSEPPGRGNPTKAFPDSAALRAEGFTLYTQRCASCHGIALQGIPGVAPSLRAVGAGPVDFYLSTGRMPLEQPREEPMRSSPAFSRTQIDALIAFVSSFGGPSAPSANPSAGNLALGFHEFTLNCAGCHQIVARGGITVNAQVPDLGQATPQQIAEAVRMGPYLMPHFDSTQIDQHDLDSIARYIVWTRHPADLGGWGIYNIGPIPEGIVAWFIGLAALVIVARLIGERMDQEVATPNPREADR